MKLQLPTFSLAFWPQRLKGMFNLNDPRWGRSDDKPADNADSGETERPATGVPETPPRANVAGFAIAAPSVRQAPIWGEYF